MLGPKLFDAEHYPLLQLRSESIAVTGDRLLATVRITLRGRETLLRVPLVLMRTGDRLIASGELNLLQTSFGLTPYSVAMGALRVRDQIDVKFRIAANRVQLP
jgi:polyisoprenoid-binding protein YceI